MHVLRCLGVPSYLPVSIAILCEETLNLHYIFRNRTSSTVSRYGSNARSSFILQ
jgi:hypothetical protein